MRTEELEARPLLDILIFYAPRALKTVTHCGIKITLR